MNLVAGLMFWIFRTMVCGLSFLVFSCVGVYWILSQIFGCSELLCFPWFAFVIFGAVRYFTGT